MNIPWCCLQSLLSFRVYIYLILRVLFVLNVFKSNTISNVNPLTLLILCWDYLWLLEVFVGFEYVDCSGWCFLWLLEFPFGKARSKAFALHTLFWTSSFLSLFLPFHSLDPILIISCSRIVLFVLVPSRTFCNLQCTLVRKRRLWRFYSLIRRTSSLRDFFHI